MTEVLTRRYLNDIMPVLLKDLERHSRPISVMFVDCDNFKVVNDTWGNAAGDAVLRAVSRALLETVRETDLTVRIGGDEFIVIFLETSGEDLHYVVDRCVLSLNAAMQAHEWPVTFSIGVVEFQQTPPDINTIVNQADQAMYIAKNNGKNSVVYKTVDRSHSDGTVNIRT